MIRLSQYKCTIVYWKLERGFNFEIKFDTADFLVTIECDADYDNPIDCREKAIDFCKSNDFNFIEDWSNL